MASVTVDTKIINVLYTGTQALTLNLANAPWLSNVVKIIRPSLNTGINTRQSYNGGFNGTTPGGAMTTMQPGALYEITSGSTNGWTLPNCTRVPVADIGQLILNFQAGSSAAFPAITILPDQAGTYALPAFDTGLTNLVYTKNGNPVAGTTTFAAGDVLIVAGTTGSAAPGTLTLTKQ